MENVADLTTLKNRNNAKDQTMIDPVVNIFQNGFSLSSRIVIAAASAAFGGLMLVIAPAADHSIGAYGIAASAFLIPVACLATGRGREFALSVLGVEILCVMLWYVGTRIETPDGRRDPMTMKMIVAIFAFGIPAYQYALRKRFGFHPVELPVTTTRTTGCATNQKEDPNARGLRPSRDVDCV
jgi:hypothetical protein